MTPLAGPVPLPTIFLAFLRLGLTSFGGPVAHIGYFRAEFVAKRRWLDEATFADLLALCQFLPGPSSSQLGMAIGLLAGRLPGLFVAWLGFTLPSAAAMTAFAVGIGAMGAASSGWLHGLKIVAAAVVAQAVWAMGRSLCPDRPRQAIAVLAALTVLAWQSPLAQLAVILAGGLAGWGFGLDRSLGIGGKTALPLGRRLAGLSLLLFFLLLAGLPWLAPIDGPLFLFDAFFRAGALVFGGGHVVLPLLQAALVPTGLIGRDAFLAGYGLAQALPGPLFTFAAYLGTVIGKGWPAGLFCVVAIFLPSFLLVPGLFPFWGQLRGKPAARAALAGVNAAVVGLLLAVFYDPVWTGAIASRTDFAILLGALLALTAGRMPPWAVVGLGSLAAFLAARLT